MYVYIFLRFALNIHFNREITQNIIEMVKWAEFKCHFDYENIKYMCNKSYDN